MTRPITVRRGVNWKGEPGYWWTCVVHPRHKGFHRFDRWTDRVRRKPDPHPWSRCMDAAVMHHHRCHCASNSCVTSGSQV